ncbi:MAG: DUF3558 family protein [Candidatus Palauibacterales bacterium]|nr:DUF3558 family protein [Candidatus Palauibacterales bacterium]
MRTTTMAASVALWTAVAIAAGGCGGGKADTSSSSSSASATETGGSFPNASLDPCSLLTVDQVAAAIGMKVDPARADSSAGEGSRGCQWTTAAYDAGGSALVGHVGIVTLIVVGPNPALASRFPTAASFFSFQKQIVPNQQPVSGVGDEAMIAGRQQDLWARKGDVVLRLFVTGGLGDTSELKPLKQLMTEALSRT